MTDDERAFDIVATAECSVHSLTTEQVTSLRADIASALREARVEERERIALRLDIIAANYKLGEETLVRGVPISGFNLYSWAAKQVRALDPEAVAGEGQP